MAWNLEVEAVAHCEIMLIFFPVCFCCDDKYTGKPVSLTRLFKASKHNALRQACPSRWQVATRRILVTDIHYDDVIMGAIASQITSLTVVYSIVYSDSDQRKHQSSTSLAFVWGIHRDRWIPRTKGQLRGKCFHLMTSSWVLLSWSRTWANHMGKHGIGSTYAKITTMPVTSFCTLIMKKLTPD